MRNVVDVVALGANEALGTSEAKVGQISKSVVTEHPEEAGSGRELVLDDAQRAVLRHNARRGLGRVLVAQAAMALIAVLFSWIFAGGAAGASALVGAGVYFVPNSLFALRLLLGQMALKPMAPTTFFVGELIKLGSAVALLVLATYLWRSWLVWPALLFGLVCVLKGYVLLIMFRRLA